MLHSADDGLKAGKNCKIRAQRNLWAHLFSQILSCKLWPKHCLWTVSKKYNFFRHRMTVLTQPRRPFVM